MTNEELTPETIEKVTEYVYENYTLLKGKPLIIKDKGTHFTILQHITGAPLFLGKGIIK